MLCLELCTLVSKYTQACEQFEEEQEIYTSDFQEASDHLARTLSATQKSRQDTQNQRDQLGEFATQLLKTASSRLAIQCTISNNQGCQISNSSSRQH